MVVVGVGWLDMFSGVSGDMLLGACLDAGVSLEELESALGGLGLEGVRLATEPTRRHGIAATRCVVEVPDTAGHRRLPEIVERIEAAGLPPEVADRSRRVFERLAAAEAAVHDVAPDEVEFHEVGALDAIVDVVGGVWCIERLGIERLVASPFTLGRGWSESAHGRLPVPVPAVMELVSGWEVRASTVKAELTTPTGAALVTTLAEPGSGPPADFVPRASGYGAGTREHEEAPNLLRLVVGEAARHAGELAIVECDLDDLSPEMFEPLADALYEAGAREVVWQPVQMKKRRPGVTVRAVAPRGAVAELGEALFAESTTLGYRWWAVGRETLERREEVVETSLGPVAVKRVRRRDGGIEVRPEYEACRRVARERGLAVRDVVRRLEAELGREHGTG
ncbi:MAG: nickel pincer cofactor biosynthesis protein LarC [Gemmatimonadota bacterium]|nr:nickel pincer cofactor biosynthesis protein LarC [Gemmatimonadota bacterium]